MNLQDLRYLVTLDQLRSFSRAAEACDVSQPTLSGQIRKLERDLGVDLFERYGRTIRATPVGETVLIEARIAVAAADRIAALALAGSDPLAGPLRVGLIPTLAPFLLSRTLQITRQQLPNMPLAITEDVTPRILSMLGEGRLDAVILATDHRHAGFEEIVLFEEPFWLATSLDHPLAGRASVFLREMQDASLMLLVDGHCLRDQALAMCADSKSAIMPANDVRATSLDTLLNLVGAGLGTTIVPALALDLARSHNVATMQLAEEGASRTVRIVYRPSSRRVVALKRLAQIISSHVPAARVRYIPA